VEVAGEDALGPAVHAVAQLMRHTAGTLENSVGRNS
jgi:hypothetical protein